MPGDRSQLPFFFSGALPLVSERLATGCLLPDGFCCGFVASGFCWAGFGATRTLGGGVTTTGFGFGGGGGGGGGVGATITGFGGGGGGGGGGVTTVFAGG